MGQQHGRIWVRSRYVIGQLLDLLYEFVNPIIVRHERHLNLRSSSNIALDYIILRMNRVGTSTLRNVLAQRLVAVAQYYWQIEPSQPILRGP
jgi:hypothetical protein